MDTPWRIEMLGRLCAQQGDLVVMRFRTQKTALLLARLALFPARDHPREELADLLWPDASLEAARNNLKQTLATLRRVIEPPGMPAGCLLIANRSTIRLNSAAFITDVSAFREAAIAGLRMHGTAAGLDLLQQAVTLYRGEFLPGFYDDWVLEERENLENILGDVQSALAEADAKTSVVTDELVSVASDELVSVASDELVSVASDDPLPSLRLPMQFTRFFGRDVEQKECVRLLQDPQTRLLTLTGPGGSGKTRLSLEVARQLASSYSNLVYFAALADITDPDFIAGRVADALHLPRESQTQVLEQVVASLSSAPALLVLDNLEQLGSAAAPAILTLLTRLPSLTTLATSRQRLYVAGEQEFPVSPLPVPALPAPNALPAPESLRQFSSVQVFVDRAQMARPDFQITARNAEAIGDVCRLLEGLPLALELAAAWAQVLTAAQMRDRLQERFSFLVSRAKNTPDRHQTLWAAIEWSTRLLTPALADFWSRLSVFRGGFTAEAAAEVCGEQAAMDYLGQLRARSLVTIEESGDTVRFRLLEMLREFGEDQLSEDQCRLLTHRHAVYFMQLAEQAEPNLTGPDQAKWLHCLAQEQDNLRFVLRVSEGQSAEPELCLRLAGALWRFWSIRGPLDEGRQFLEKSLENAEAFTETPAAARALNGLAVLTRRQGDLEAAEAIQYRCLALWRTLEDTRGIASSLNNLGTLTTLKSDFAAAEPLLQESLALWRKLEQPLSIAQTLNNLGFLAQEQGQPEEAHRLCSESLAIFRKLNNPQGKTLSLTILATSAVALKAYETALPHCREILEIAWALSDIQATVTCLQLLAEIRFCESRSEEAAHLLGSASHLRDEIGSFQDRRAQIIVAHLTETVKNALPLSEFTSAWAAGQALTLEESIAFALNSLSRLPYT